MCALLHDVGDTLGTWNHPDIAAAILKPFVYDENHWMVQNHAIFQGYNFFHHIGMDRNLRDRFKGHAHYQRTERFVARYDNPAFDPAVPCDPLESFVPALRALMSAPRSSIYQE